MEASLQGTTFTPMASLPYSSHVRARGHAVLPILTARDAARHRQERPRRRERTLKPIQTTAAELWARRREYTNHQEHERPVRTLVRVLAALSSMRRHNAKGQHCWIASVQSLECRP